MDLLTLMTSHLNYLIMMCLKKSANQGTKSTVSGDLPKVIVEHFSAELSSPIAKVWPASWKTEYGVPLKKVSNPKSEDELRIISLT